MVKQTKPRKRVDLRALKRALGRLESTRMDAATQWRYRALAVQFSSVLGIPWKAEGYGFHAEQRQRAQGTMADRKTAARVRILPFRHVT